MAKLIDVVRKTQSALLVPGEEYLIATKVHRKKGFFGGIPAVDLVTVASRDHPPGVTLREEMIWAASNYRLFIWSTDALTRTKPKRVLGVFPYGTEVHGVQAEDKRGVKGAPSGKTYMTLYLRGVPVATEVSVTSAYKFAQVVNGHLPPLPPQGF